MVKRRSLDDALTPEQKRFLKTGSATSSAKPAKPKSPPKPQPKNEEPNMSKSALKRHIIDESPPAAISAKPAPTPLKYGTLSVRMDSTIVAAILRAMTERKIDGTVPWVQQEIVTEAMLDWLKKHGYFR